VNQNAQAFLNALLLASKHQEELLPLLPPELAGQLQNLPPSYVLDPPTFFSASQWSTRIHYSWFTDMLSDYPQQVRSLFLGALAPSQAKGIQQQLSLPAFPPIASAFFLRPFLMHILRTSMQDPDLLNEQLLPPSPCNTLLNLERGALLHMCDLLGLYDLAADLRQVVDKELLKKIYDTLTKGQLLFLHYCSKQPLKWVSPKLGLLAWDGSKQRLNHLLHYRGLIRLAKGIAQEDHSFKWHLMHRFDTGRAKIIQRELYRKQDPSLLSYFKNQVLHIAKRYQE
jgi:hypothetical protein